MLNSDWMLSNKQCYQKNIKLWLFNIKIAEKPMRSRFQFWLVDIKFIENFMINESRFWLVITTKTTCEEILDVYKR